MKYHIDGNEVTRQLSGYRVTTDEGAVILISRADYIRSGAAQKNFAARCARVAAQMWEDGENVIPAVRYI